MNELEATAVSPSGLRYTLKEGGSPFQGMGSSGETMSCIKCGHHKLRRNGSYRRFATALMFFCSDCRTPRQAPGT